MGLHMNYIRMVVAHHHKNGWGALNYEIGMFSS